jgi:hypothetical protein
MEALVALRKLSKLLYRALPALLIVNIGLVYLMLSSPFK